jgi:signal transduction histidine kinase
MVSERVRSIVAMRRIRHLGVPAGAVCSILAGLAGAALLAVGASATLHDTLAILAFALAGSAVAGMVALLGLWVVRNRSLGLQVAVVAVAASATIAAGVVIAARAMFLSGHDVAVLAVMLAAGTGTASALGILAGGRLRRQLADVETVAAHLVDRSADARPVPRTQVAEIARLRQRLVDSATAVDAARARQAALEEARREFVAWASHDLRSPIATIRAIAELLEDDLVDGPAERASHYRAIRDESIRLGTLVDDLFELARLESGTPVTDQDTAPVADVVSDTVDVLHPAAAARAVNIVDLLNAGDAPVPVTDFGRVLRNLLDNAIRHTSPGGSVVIDGDVVDGALILSVTDECGGIPDDDLERVFDVGFRGDLARRRDTGGAGLGLAIAKGLLSRRGGYIVATNRARGCRFTVHLPLETPPMPDLGDSYEATRGSPPSDVER